MEKFDGLSFYGHEDKELQKEYERMFCNMTQEDKELLLRDLSARLPYGVKIYSDIGGDNTLLCIYGDRVFTTCEEPDKHNDYPLDCIKPYLRPISSMTDEEKKQYRKTQDKISVQWDDCGQSIGYIYANTIKTYDWLNKNHFDYRNLIKKSLAIIAPEGMYKI